MKYHKLYVGRSKSFELKEEKLIVLPCAKKTHSKFILCRVCFFGTRQTIDFAVCQREGTRQSMDFPCVFLSRVLLSWHTTKWLFAVCPIESTRQTMKHTANLNFPVVYIAQATNHGTIA